MAEFKYTQLTPPPVPNTTIKKVFIDGVHRFYNISAIDGYLLHDSRADTENDELGNFSYKECFFKGKISVGADYDFYTLSEKGGNSQIREKYGKYKLYAVPESEARENE